jgi:hypothetical protein
VGIFEERMGMCEGDDEDDSYIALILEQAFEQQTCSVTTPLAQASCYVAMPVTTSSTAPAPVSGRKFREIRKNIEREVEQESEQLLSELGWTK